MDKPKFCMKKSDIVVISLILLLALGCALFYFFAANSSTTVAVLSVNGETLREIRLATAEDSTFQLEDLPVSFEIKDHKIRFVNVTCPDHLCENVGFVSKAGELAVCMPNKTAVTIR